MDRSLSIVGQPEELNQVDCSEEVHSDFKESYILILHFNLDITHIRDVIYPGVL